MSATGGKTIQPLAAPQALDQDAVVEQPFADQAEIQQLIATGGERGYLTFEEIAATLEEVEVTKEQVAALHSHLVDQGVDVIAADGVSAFKEQREAEEGASKKPDLELTVEPSLDSLRLYLRSIGRVALLRADQEVALARRIERGDMIAKRQMVEANLRRVV